MKGKDSDPVLNQVPRLAHNDIVAVVFGDLQLARRRELRRERNPRKTDFVRD